MRGAHRAGLLLLLGCASDPIESTPALTVDGGGQCIEGTSTCFGQVHQICRNGFLQDEATCDGTCTPGLGCGDCDPSRSTFCEGDALHTCTEGRRGDFIRDCAMGCSEGSCTGECAEGAELIYVVDVENTLLSFDPRTNFFNRIGTLRCPAAEAWPEFSSSPARPFSMAVDRSGRAWVLYSSGEIFWVDIRDATCRPSGFARGSQGFELFGMGFVTDTPGRPEETLFIAGGSAADFGDGTLAAIDPTTLALTAINPMPPGEYGAELTGNGDAELWAYYPGLRSRVVRLDKRSAGEERGWDLPPLFAEPAGWAFAHWGGRYFVFISTGDGEGGLLSAQVLRFNPANGFTEVVVWDTGRRIVGAGVSTCAPTVSNF